MSLFQFRLFTAAVFLLPTFAAAQFVACPFVPTPYLAVSPPAPSSSQTFSVTVAEFNFVPTAVAYSVNGNVIEMTLNGYVNAFAATIGTTCSTVNVGPLQPGDYTVRFLLGGLAPGSPSTLRASEALSIGTDPSAIPVSDGPWLLVASLLVALLGLRSISRRHAP